MSLNYNKQTNEAFYTPVVHTLRGIIMCALVHKFAHCAYHNIFALLFLNCYNLSYPLWHIHTSSSAQPTEEQVPAAIQPTVIQANQGGDSLLIGDLLSLDIGSGPTPSSTPAVDLGK